MVKTKVPVRVEKSTTNYQNRYALLKDLEKLPGENSNHKVITEAGKLVLEFTRKVPIQQVFPCGRQDELLDYTIDNNEVNVWTSTPGE